MNNRTLLEDALDKYFPDSDISIFEAAYMKNGFQVGIEQKRLRFSFFVKNNFIEALQSKYNDFEDTKKVTNIILPDNDIMSLINNFMKSFYEGGDFRKIMTPFSYFDQKKMYEISGDEESLKVIHNLSNSSTSICRIDNKKYLFYLNYQFKMTRKREMIAVPVLSFFTGKDIDFQFDIAFNIEKQSIYFVKSYPMYYEDFFEENDIFDFDKDLDIIFRNFIEKNVMKNIDPTNELGRQLVSLGDDMDEKLKLLIMYSI